MKKFKRLIPLLLCAVLMLQMAALPASATQATETQAAQTGQTQSGETQATAATEAEFGAVSIDSGCRTIDGKNPSGRGGAEAGYRPGGFFVRSEHGYGGLFLQPGYAAGGRRPCQGGYRHCGAAILSAG